MAGFWQDFERALHKKEERRPTGKGWRTFGELLAAYPKVSPRRMRKVLLDTKAETFRGATMKESGALNHQVWYRCK